MKTLETLEIGLEGEVRRLVSVGGLDVELMLGAPCTSELFRNYADLVVVSDYVGYSAFARLVDSSSLYTAGFLSAEVLDGISSRFGHRARDPRGLLDLPVQQRVRLPNIDRHCSLVPLGLFDRKYQGRFLFFVPSLVYDDLEVPDLYAEQYAECAMYVAAARKSQAVYFAGFGGTDGSFEDSTLVKIVDRIHDARAAMPLPPVHVMFKYFSLATTDRINRLISRISAQLRASARM